MRKVNCLQALSLLVIMIVNIRVIVAETVSAGRSGSRSPFLAITTPEKKAVNVTVEICRPLKRRYESLWVSMNHLKQSSKVGLVRSGNAGQNALCFIPCLSFRSLLGGRDRDGDAKNQLATVRCKPTWLWLGGCSRGLAGGTDYVSSSQNIFQLRMVTHG